LPWADRPFRTTEIADDEKPRILGAYLARWSYQVRPYFRALPNASDHPVFRIERVIARRSEVVFTDCGTRRDPVISHVVDSPPVDPR
jgi:hypothetical protein